MCVDSVLTLSERFPVVQSTYELIGVKGRTLLRPGVQRTSSAHLQDRNTKADGEREGGKTINAANWTDVKDNRLHRGLFLS